MKRIVLTAMVACLAAMWGGTVLADDNKHYYGKEECLKKKTELVCDAEQATYKKLCESATSATRGLWNGMKNGLYPTVTKYARASTIDGIRIYWTQAELCYITIQVHGMLEGTSFRKTIYGKVVRFTRNKDGEVLAHATLYDTIR